MGLSLSKVAQWTTASPGSGKLKQTRINKSLLKEVLLFVEQLSSQHPLESEHVFEEPLQWSTTLVASDFKTDYDISDSDVQSHEKDSEGRPLLQLSPPTVYVRSFSQLSKLVHLADDKKLEEVQACLEENKDPVVKIIGPSFASILEGKDTDTDVQGLADKVKEEDRGKDSDIRVKLLLLLQNMDNQLLRQFLKEIDGQAGLDPAAVRNEVELLKRLCSEGEKRVLKSVRYTSDYVFSNGCRAPPWRQALHEICYLVIKPCDTETLYITCGTAGFFLNGGIKQEGEESDYERKSDTYKDLETLLKNTSPHFAVNTNKQEQGQPQRSYEEKKAYEALRQRALKRRYELCPRWRDLAERCGVAEEKKQGKSSGEEKSGEIQKKDLGARPKTKMKADSVSPLPGRLSSLKIVAEEKKQGKSSGEEKSGEIQKKDLGARAKTKMKTNSVSSLPGRRSSQKSKTPAGSVPVEAFSESSTESEEEEEQPERRPESNTDLPPEYWQIQKLVKWLKAGDQTATVLTLVHLMDFNLMQETCQLAIRDLGGLDVLINLLDTDEDRCKIGSLRILRKISHNMQIRRTIVYMGGLRGIVKILDSPVKELKALAAETIANVARFCKARRTVRQFDGIKKLVKLLDCFPNLAKQFSQTKKKKKQEKKNQEKDVEKDVEVARCGALALWSCSKSTKNKEAILKAGGIPLLGCLLKSQDENMLIPVVGILQECASEESYRTAIKTNDMIRYLVKNLRRDNDELQMHCASAIFKCADDKQTCDLVRLYKGLQPLVSLLSKANNKLLLAAVTGAIWKCSINLENMAKFQEYNVVETLVGLLTDQPDEVLVNVVGAVREFARIPANMATIRKSGGIRSLVDLLIGTNQALLVNVTKAVGACATDMENMVIINQLDGIRLVWSLLKNPSTDVQSSAAWALCPCIENAKDSGETVRSLVGGLALIIDLLKSTNNEVLASICAAIVKIAADKENLAVLTDHGVVQSLAKLTNTTDDRLRRHLAEAVGQCCKWKNNRASFGEAGAVAPLVGFLKSKEHAVHQSTAMALFHLSWDPHNCITMHSKGVIKPLIQLMGSHDELLQENAAGCARNIRMLAQANRDAREVRRCLLEKRRRRK